MSQSVKTPNSEQMVAISHAGGKILSAGAGSGKTYVIIEHIITRLEGLRLKTPQKDWPHAIPFFLPKIVLMTFTKKAAGEMSIRMMRRIDDLCENDADEAALNYWQIVRQYLSMMNITTISSFCHQLIKQGYFPEVGSDIQILSDVEFKNKISNLFNLWFVSQKILKNQVFEANSHALINAMIEIYQSPELRLLWRVPQVKTSASHELQQYVEKMKADLELSSLFENDIDLSAEAKEKTKGWYVFLQSFDQLLKTEGLFSAQNFRAYASWAITIGRLPVVAKSMTEEQKEVLAQAKDLVKALRDVQEDFISFIENYDIYWSWVETFQDIYHFIDRNYFVEKGFSFADLEYHACIGLRDEEIRQKIKKNYDYFIVDEFQDTSSVQYEILQHLTGEDHQRIFCVGDKKQAIYGFRGGELLVFNQCLEMLGEENNLWLKSNFRSFGKIIHFNNHFFEQVFPLGHGFEGIDHHSVAMEAQIIPESKKDQGEVVRFKSEIIGVKNEKKVNVDFYEALALYEIIKDLLKREDIEEVCVLYRKLRPSASLLDLLAENEVSFSAQVKIQYGEDPIINLFLRFIELKLNQNDSAKLSSTHFLINRLLEVLNVNAEVSDIQKNFLGDLEILGLRLAFHKTIYSLGISNSQYRENSNLLDSICRVCHEDPLKVFQLLGSEEAEDYSLQLMNGSRGKRVIIMSAHASKGLEFDAVLLGGVHSNGLQMGKTDTIGKMPKSFRWKKAYNQKKFYKSPTYYLEAEIDKAREFSESKRLLYVANTRAVKYLAWVDLWANVEGVEKELGAGPNHWIKAMRLIIPEENILRETHLQINWRDEKERPALPLILKDSLGLIALDHRSHLGVFAETSVTKLTHIAQCPFKFYLSTICKISPPSISPKLFADIDEEEDALEEEIFYSSMQRGVRVHADLAKIILGEIEIDEVDVNEKEKFEWVQREAQLMTTNKNIISEKQIKFSFFGQMISGIPDLVFENNDEIIIWDFKTGHRIEENEEGYWFQLMCYGYAYANLKRFTPEKMIPLSLLYVDQKKIITRSLSLAQISTILFEKWSKTESLNQVNLEHCRHCEYSSICLHSKTSLL